jgi:hypothetical protein
VTKAGKKHFGAGSQGKGDGSGAMSGNADMPENMVLSNRDKARRASGRGQDEKWIKTEQRHDSELYQKKE